MEAKKSDIKENLATGVSTAVGTASGIVIGAALIPGGANADEIQSEEIEFVSDDTQNTMANQTEQTDNLHLGDDSVEIVDSVPDNVILTASETEEKPVVEMVGYERANNGNGMQVDIAIVKIDGIEVGFIDADMDGRADFIASDLDGNGQIGEGEIAYITEHNIGMQQFQDAADFNPLYAQNDLPDYVNDAEVDIYMA